MATRIKEKAAKRQANADKRPHAIARYIRISPYKVRIVLDIIRGKGYDEAVAILANTPKAASEPLLKLVKSAAANAEHNMGLTKSDLYVAECFCDQGPTLKRIQPVSKGRAHRINKRTSHITVILDTVTK
jgi:large subunit ribosomal protein L22